MPGQMALCRILETIQFDCAGNESLVVNAFAHTKWMGGNKQHERLDSWHELCGSVKNKAANYEDRGTSEMP